jgi:serine acetyltransferase
VLGKVEIGHHAVVAAAAVVLDSAPPGAVVAGIPATMRRFRDGFGPLPTPVVNAHVVEATV